METSFIPHELYVSRDIPRHVTEYLKTDQLGMHFKRNTMITDKNDIVDFVHIEILSYDEVHRRGYRRVYDRIEKEGGDK